MNKQVLYISIFTFLIFSLFVSCEKEHSDTNPSGRLTSYTDCKDNKNFYATDSISSSMSCVEYVFNNGVLSLTHVNAGFNCCPETIGADITFSENVITINEYETKHDCDCNCLYDIDIEIDNLESSTYDFIFVEPYISFLGEELIFTVNLADSTHGVFCVERVNYPWGI